MELYELLFADQDLDELLLETSFDPDGPLYAARARLWAGQYVDASTLAAGKGEPWSSFIVSAARMKAGQSAQRTLVYVADGDFETRARLWAWNALRKANIQPSALQASDALGVVLEVPFSASSQDVLAAYADGSSRFLGHANNMIIRDKSDDFDPLIEDLLSQAQPLLKVPPAPRPRTVVPVGHVRVTALSAMGVHPILIPWSEFDPAGKYADLFKAATALLQKTTAKKP